MPLYRRRHHRVPIRLFIDQFRGQEQWVGLTFNLGSGGLYLCQRPQPIPSEVGLELDLPGLSESIWTKAEVCSVVSQGKFMGVGMAFTAMADGHRSMLQDWVIMARRRMRRYNERRATLRRLAA